MKRSINTLRLFSTAVLVMGVCLGIWTGSGHFHRYSFEDQTKDWNDGLNDFFYQDNDEDQFSEEYYEQTNSVKSAVKFIERKYSPADHYEILEAVYDFTRKRFKHFMYPHHTFFTNAYLSIGELLFPSMPINGMYLADTILRHSAVAACGNSTATFIEIYRAMGGKAQFVTYASHIVAEAEIDGKKYLVDTDYEALVPHGVDEVMSSPDIIERYYQHKTPEQVESYKRYFLNLVKQSGYAAPPAYRAEVYRFMQFVEYFKWAFPFLLLLIGYWGMVKSTRAGV